jgi:hypothetical protein
MRLEELIEQARAPGCAVNDVHVLLMMFMSQEAGGGSRFNQLSAFDVRVIYCCATRSRYVDVKTPVRVRTINRCLSRKRHLKITIEVLQL